jgi:hypothetical protein
MFLFGELDEIAYGDFRLVRKISAEANTPIGDRIASKSTTLKYEPISRQARKGGTDAIKKYLQRGVEALSFDLDKKNYYVPDVVRKYIERLTEGPYLKYVVFYERGGKMKAVADAREIAAHFRMRNSRLTPHPPGQVKAEAKDKHCGPIETPMRQNVQVGGALIKSYTILPSPIKHVRNKRYNNLNRED